MPNAFPPLPAARAAGAGLVLAALLAAGAASADETAIRRNLMQRIPGFPKIDEVSKTPIPGVYELRLGTEILYTDEKGEHLIDGTVIDTATRQNLTQARIDKLTAIDFAALPLKDAVVWKQGSGARKLVVFADPNCGYCKKFESEMTQVKDVTVYTFLYPILGGDSGDKARDIWCAKDNGTVWRNWMIHGTAVPKSMGPCDTAALERNVALGRKYRINGTPALVFSDGRRMPGALPPEQVEKHLAEAKARS